jgi:superfamily II DNA/RNA helicase
MDFQALGLAQPLVRALADSGYNEPTPVQAQAIPAAIAGQDLKVAAATGSGKTAAFMLPALEKILKAREERRIPRGPRGPSVLVLAPTRELAQQVARATQGYGRHIAGLKVLTVVGGVPYATQLRMLRSGVDVLIATPGRMLDHFGAGKLDLSSVETFVLDEADRMLDMGFIDDIRHVASQLPHARQTLMFSATFAGAAGHLASEMMRPDAQTLAVARHTERHDNIEQRLHWADNGGHKHKILEQLLAEPALEQALVFTSTQQDADWVADQLAEIGHAVASLHGGMPQGRRNRVLTGLRTRQLRVLVATDVAARGIDVPGISHVINYGLPMKAEDYVHRIGRTGRAGRSGIAITLAERRDIGLIKRIQHYTTQPIPVSVVSGLEPKLPAPELSPMRRPAPGGFRPGGPGPRRHGHVGARGFGPGPGHAPREGFGHDHERGHPGQRPGVGHPGQRPAGVGHPGQRPAGVGHPGQRPGVGHQAPRGAGPRPTSGSSWAGSNRAGKPGGRAPR